MSFNAFFYPKIKTIIVFLKIMSQYYHNRIPKKYLFEFLTHYYKIEKAAWKLTEP